jgi:sortase (surface protein transpeptidase)
MKFFIAVTLISSSVIAAPTGAKRILPVKKEDEAVKKEQMAKAKLKMLDKKEADCDEKAKKPVEIKPESISLTGNAGCSLDQAH